MGVVTDIKRSYRAPRKVLRHRIGTQANEGGALVTLMLGCAMVFVSQWPRQSREAFETGQDLQMMLGGSLLGWLFIMPLAFYVLALLINVVQRIIGANASGYETRMAVFWGLLAASPLWLLWGLTAGFVGDGAASTLTGLLALGALFYFWGAGLIETSSKATSGNEKA